MPRYILKTALRLIVCALVFGINPASSFALSYHLTDLGVLGTKTYAASTATAINNQGQVVGYSTFPNDGQFTSRHAFIYENGDMRDLTPNTVDNSDAQGINDQGQVVGHLDGRAVVFDSGTVTDVGTMQPYGITYATDINNHGQVTGYTSGEGAAVNVYHAFRYEDGSIDDLDTLRPSQSSYESYGQAINDLGQIVGFSSPNFGSGFVYTDGEMKALENQLSWAEDINNSGEIVGFAREEWNGLNCAFIYSDGQFSELKGLDASTSYAHAINKYGKVVGDYYLDELTHSLAFLYDGTSMVDLNDLIVNDDWLLLSAADINDHGQIVGQGVINGQTHAYLLTPVPEPSTFLLSGVGIMGLLIWRKKSICFN